MFKNFNGKCQLKLYILIVLMMPVLLCSKTSSGKETKTADYLKVYWQSIQYYKSVTNYNQKAYTNQSQPKNNSSENLQLTCKVEILDPNFVLGTSRQAIIQEITDSKGNVIAAGDEFPDTSLMSYEGLRYEMNYVQPKQDPKWKVVLESVLQIRKKKNTGPQMRLELRPNNLSVPLNMNILKKADGEISIKGYFYILSAKSLKRIDLPFEPNDTWIQLTDNDQIKIKDVNRSGSSITYNIESRQLNGNQMFSLKVGDYLPSQLIMSRKFVKSDGSLSSAFLGGSSQLPAHYAGSGSMGGSDVATINKIRFEIAQDPNHVKIPFELKNIPVPKP